ncbi:hypothetical protein PIB30_073432 [Stylosanthes scabra]|uniref:Uncharacterized protein n=1 Tax=Stylosanthes scabra TaxID=79078 RepID=A0ABU6TPH5_9FABA|nr:hypothetical protein [Stylosanthes scabra]
MPGLLRLLLGPPLLVRLFLPPPLLLLLLRLLFRLLQRKGEEGAKEDPSADLKKKGRKRKALGASAEEAALGTDSSWVRKVSPINRAFPDEYNFREALDAGLTNGPTREILGPLVPEQLLGTAQHLACQLTACLQVSTFLYWDREIFCLQGSDEEGASFSEGSSGRAYGGKGFGPGSSSSECRD